MFNESDGLNRSGSANITTMLTMNNVQVEPWTTFIDIPLIVGSMNIEMYVQVHIWNQSMKQWVRNGWIGKEWKIGWTLEVGMETFQSSGRNNNKKERQQQGTETKGRERAISLNQKEKEARERKVTFGRTLDRSIGLLKRRDRREGRNHQVLFKVDDHIGK